MNVHVRKRFIRWSLLFVISTELAVCIGIVGYATLHRPAVSKSESVTPPAPIHTEVLPQTVNAGLPVRLKIPKINIDAVLDYVGLTAKGEMGTPKGPTTAAWYSPGPRPGDTGNAVIDGHFGYKDNLPAVFDNLHTLQIGDPVYVEDDKGVTIAFVVRELRTYGPNDDASNVFRPSDGKEHLNLITCQGVWNEHQKSYSTRLVVFADKRV